MKYPLKSGFILSLFYPWLASVLLQAAPISSYLIAWLGSFFIFYQTWFSKDSFVLMDLPKEKQIMRPLFLQQAIFAGFMCCTSIFYFIDAMGYKYFDQVAKMDLIQINEGLELVAKCQRFSVLGHAALVTGILLGQKKTLGKGIDYVPIKIISIDNWIIRIGIISFIISFILEKAPGFFQFSLGFYNVTIFCGAVTFVKGIRNKHFVMLGWGGFIFIVNLAIASLSGYKEPLIVNFIILFCLLYPHYKREVSLIAVPFFALLFYFAPTYAIVIRKQAWSGETTAENARQEAVETILDEENTLEETNWTFLTGRLSEIGMFTQFVKTTPETVPYYHLDIITNAIISIVPRALWKEKPITEEVAMQRVYDAGVIDNRSVVSAKARPIVDAYLSGGIIGVIIYMFSFGYLSQSLCNKAERLFGGYETGGIIFFNGFFQTVWRGETTEFMANTIFWAFIAMIIFWLGLRLTNYIEKANPLDYTKI
ncbi:exosortase Y-associated Wzy-like protein [Desertivirga arenae]|uniref:exosortase Y-associated Wzy-like protein n=1 Tax=Desertivirga arenae TaxID=2810309 RepID=UPI001A957C9D|nr:hypothetical protein [Pedobacter sp. SYSU D00823]